MRSLRSRLILGSSLVAVIPLAVVMYLLSQRIETMVRTQAAARLNAALGGLRSELQSDGEQIAEKLQILARDPVLKRLYLVRTGGSRDLSEYLAEMRFLLGLGFLQVLDLSGNVVADGSAAGMAVAGDHEHARSAGDAGAPGDQSPVVERLEGASGLAMAASASIRYENEPAGVVHGGLALDGRFLERLKRASGVDLILRDGVGHIVASTLGDAHDLVVPLGAEVGRVELPSGSYQSRSFPLDIGTPPYAGITGLVSTSSADRTIATLQLTSLLLGVMGLGIAVLLGLLWSSQVSRPVEQLAAFSRKLAQGEWDEPLVLHSVRELETLVAALDRMRKDLKTYRDKLVISERQEAWGQMARRVAHEIKNPLTPIAVSVADLKRSYEQKRPDFSEILDQAVRTVADEVETLKHLLQEFSDFARFPPPRLAPCRLSDVMADLGALYRREVTEGRLLFASPDRDVTFSADPGQMRQALVNLIKNGLEALNGDGRVVVSTAVESATVEIAVSDTGPGLSAEQKAHLFVPGFTTKAEGSGLGLTIVERIVNDHQGTITVHATPGTGTTFRIRLPLEHSTAAPRESGEAEGT